MRKLLILVWIMTFTIIVYPQQSSIKAQTNPFQQGDWVLTTQALDVYAQSTISSSKVTIIPQGFYVRIVREPVFNEDHYWFYIEDLFNGWVSQPAYESIFIVADTTTLQKLLTQYTERIEANPTDYETFRLRAFVYFNLREYVKAAEDMQVYVDSFNFMDDNYEQKASYWQGWLGKFYWDTKDDQYELLIDLNLSEIGPTPVRDLMMRIWVATIEDQALPGFPIMTGETYLEIIRKAPDWAYPYVKAGNRAFVIDNLVSAELYYKQAIEIDPEYSPALYSLGWIYSHSDDEETAIDYYTQAIEANPFSGTPHSLRADSYVALSRINEAIDDYLMAIELEPNNPFVYERFGTYNLMFGNFDQAIEQFDQAIELNTIAWQVYANKGASHTYLGEYEEAIDAYEIAEELSNRSFATANLAIDFRLGELYLELDRFEEAEAPLHGFSRCCDSSDSPWSVITDIMLGRVLVELGKYDKALETYEHAFSVNANVALNYMGWANDYRRVIVTDQDIRSAQRAVDADPNNGELYFELGKEQLELGYWIDAIASFRTYDVLSDDVPDEFNNFVDELEDIVLQR